MIRDNTTSWNRDKHATDVPERVFLRDFKQITLLCVHWKRFEREALLPNNRSAKRNFPRFSTRKIIHGQSILFSFSILEFQTTNIIEKIKDDRLKQA